nr:MAG TPA: Cytosine specific methyltransferase [Caudoviricetes sp.]
MRGEKMKVLVACEESQEVCKAFRALGHEAYSCDIQEPSGGHPEWHILGDALKAIDGGQVTTMDKQTHDVGKWDLLIAHPPCTYLTVTGNRWFNISRYGGKAVQRYKDREEAADFFMRFVKCNSPKVAIENPIGYMSTAYQKPTQIIHPYMFGDPARKETCLWLKGLPKLTPTDIVEPDIIHYQNGNGTDNPWHMETMKLPPKERAKARSKTFYGIAKAMAEQWGGDIREE